MKETGGAASDYQHVIIELKGLKRALQQLERLEPTDDNASHVNAVRAMALACQLPLREFLDRIESFEPSMGPSPTRGLVHSGARKAQWAVYMTKEIEKLRALIGAKVISINLLLATHTT